MAEKMITSSCRLTIFLLSLALISVAATGSPDPVPAPWPLQFHALLIMNYTETDNGLLELNNLWYDWPNGRNFQIIQNQLGVKYYAYEWNNGTTFYFTLDEDGNSKACHDRRYPIGILRPNWLNGANYLGQAVKDGFLCNVWEKVEFVWYYEDVVSKRPVYWEFYNGLITHVMTFEVGKVLDESDSQAPAYCFADGATQESKPILESTLGFPVNPSLMRDIPSNPIVI